MNDSLLKVDSVTKEKKVFPENQLLFLNFYEGMTNDEFEESKNEMKSKGKLNEHGNFVFNIPNSESVDAKIEPVFGGGLKSIKIKFESGITYFPEENNIEENKKIVGPVEAINLSTEQVAELIKIYTDKYGEPKNMNFFEEYIWDGGNKVIKMNIGLASVSKADKIEDEGNGIISNDQFDDLIASSRNANQPEPTVEDKQRRLLYKMRSLNKKERMYSKIEELYKVPTDLIIEYILKDDFKQQLKLLKIIFENILNN
jgi:hypothetical protein